METVAELYPSKWAPDEALRFAALDGRITVTELPKADRAWLVAQLTFEGVCTDVIAQKLHCSRRTVQQIRCDPVAVLVTRLLRLETETARVQSRAKAAVNAAAYTQLVHQVDSLKRDKWMLVDQLADMRRRCGSLSGPDVVIVKATAATTRPRDTRGRFMSERAVECFVPLFAIPETASTPNR